MTTVYSHDQATNATNGDPALSRVEPEEYFRLIVDFTFDWEMWLEPGGKCLYVSPSCERITGYSPEAFRSAPGLLQTIVHPEDRERFARHVAEEIASPEPLELEFRILTRTGEERWISHACQPVYDDSERDLGRRSSNRDITDRVRTEQAYRTLVDNTLQALFIFQDGEVVFANTAAATMSGFAVEEMTGWHVEDMIRHVHEEDAPWVWQRFLDRVAGKPVPHHYNFRFVRKDGELRWWEIYSVGVPHWGRPAVHVTCLDISERKQAELGREQALAALHQSEELYRRRSTELEALHEVSLRLTSQLEVNALLKVIIEQAVALLGVAAGGLLLYDALKGTFRLEVGTDYIAEVVGTTFSQDEGLAGRVLKSRRTMTLSDYRDWPHKLAATDHLPKLRYLMAVPLLGKSGLVGVLDFASENREFEQRDIWLAEMFAAQATVALENARLHAEAERKARETTALHKAGQAITALFDREAVLRFVINEACDLLKADGVWVLLCASLPDGSCHDLIVMATNPGLDHLVGTRIPVGASISGAVARTQLPELVDDARHDPRFYGAIDQASGLDIRSLLVAPLIVRNNVLGVVEASSQSPGAFDEHDLQVFEAMAQSAAIALDNASLIQAVREQVQRLQESQAQMVRVEKMAALGRMAATLAHEVNNPLQAIQSHLELVMDFPLPPEQHAQFLGVVRNEIDRLKEIVQRVLNFSRPTTAPRRTVALADLVRQTLALAGKQLQRTGITVDTEVPEMLFVTVGRDQMVQVFLNLVINAIEAIGESGHIWIRARAEQSSVLIGFENDGRPIPAGDLPHVFEPFYTTKADGTGLGLAVSQNLVEQHGGKLTVENRPLDQGVIFTLQLPLSDANGDEP